ncbi:hypothetical protein CDD83_7746 [Cordyceps sp. RAO-2017]|nr:hypothetical protein CDD83_7746 [Cordyceps sp. RAO-2017]
MAPPSSASLPRQAHPSPRSRALDDDDDGDDGDGPPLPDCRRSDRAAVPLEHHHTPSTSPPGHGPDLGPALLAAPQPSSP